MKTSIKSVLAAMLSLCVLSGCATTENGEPGGFAKIVNKANQTYGQVRLHMHRRTVEYCQLSPQMRKVNQHLVDEYVSAGWRIDCDVALAAPEPIVNSSPVF